MCTRCEDTTVTELVNAGTTALLAQLHRQNGFIAELANVVQQLRVSIIPARMAAQDDRITELENIVQQLRDDGK